MMILGKEIEESIGITKLQEDCDELKGIIGKMGSPYKYVCFHGEGLISVKNNINLVFDNESETLKLSFHTQTIDRLKDFLNDLEEGVHEAFKKLDEIETDIQAASQKIENASKSQ